MEDVCHAMNANRGAERDKNATGKAAAAGAAPFNAGVSYAVLYSFACLAL